MGEGKRAKIIAGVLLGYVHQVWDFPMFLYVFIFCSFSYLNVLLNTRHSVILYIFVTLKFIYIILCHRYFTIFLKTKNWGISVEKFGRLRLR